MSDIAPELINSIKETYIELISKSDKYAALKSKALKGAATYDDAHKFAIEIGDELVKAYKLKLSADILPDGRMYYNIAQRLVNETLRIPQSDLSDYCEGVQTTLNDAAGIGLKAAVPEVNQDRIDGIVQKIADAEDFNNVDWLLDDPIKNILQSEVDDFVRKNADLHYNAGMRPKIVRTMVGRPCKWCRNLAGVYDYPVDNEDVYRRHENCRCTVTFVPTKGKKQNVWTKIEY